VEIIANGSWAIVVGFIIRVREKRDLSYKMYEVSAMEVRGKSIEAKMSEKDREMQAMKQKYDQDLQAIRDETNQRFSQIMSMIQHNPKLAHVKPEALVKKR